MLNTLVTMTLFVHPVSNFIHRVFHYIYRVNNPGHGVCFYTRGLNNHR